MPGYFCDYTRAWTTLWVRWLGAFVGAPSIRGLEVGCFEGRTSIWSLDNSLTHPSSTLTCVDKYFPPRFYENLQGSRSKLRIVEETSQVALRRDRFQSDSFHFIYVDGSHFAHCVLEDAVLAFRLLRPGGCLIFDDYEWRRAPDAAPVTEPKIAIDAFLSVYEGHYGLLHKQQQVAIEKFSPRDSLCARTVQG